MSDSVSYIIFSKLSHPVTNHMFSSHGSFVMCFTVVLAQMKEISEKKRREDNVPLAIAAGIDNQSFHIWNLSTLIQTSMKIYIGSQNIHGEKGIYIYIYILDK
jgi:hypothetical protein